MSAEDRKRRVDFLFKKIAFIAESIKDIDKRDAKIKPMADELWAITKVQWDNGELDHLHRGEQNG